MRKMTISSTWANRPDRQTGTGEDGALAEPLRSLLLAVRAVRGVAAVAFRSAGGGCLWCDVLVDVEEVAGIVGPLDLDQPVVVLAVVVPDLVVVVVLHEVDVATRL
jgi:hypothetical protein